MKRNILLECAKDDNYIKKQEDNLLDDFVKIRIESGISQKNLSESVDMSQPSLARLESKKISPGINTLIKLLIPMGYTLKIVPVENNK